MLFSEAILVVDLFSCIRALSASYVPLPLFWTLGRQVLGGPLGAIVGRQATNMGQASAVTEVVI